MYVGWTKELFELVDWPAIFLVILAFGVVWLLWPVGWKSRDSVPALVKEYLAGDLKVDEFVTHSLPISKINDAFDLMHHGQRFTLIVCLPYLRGRRTHTYGLKNFAIMWIVALFGSFCIMLQMLYSVANFHYNARRSDNLSVFIHNK